MKYAHYLEFHIHQPIEFRFPLLRIHPVHFMCDILLVLLYLIEKN